MAALLVPLFGIFLLLSPLNESLILMSQTTAELAALDEKLGNKAEELATSINLAIGLNTGLKTIHLSCGAATISGTLPALEAAAEAIRLEQDLLLMEAYVSIKTISPVEFSTTLNNPERGVMGPCGLPDVLQCPLQKIFQISHRAGSKPAGVLGQVSGLGMECSDVLWKYSDIRVKAL